MEIRVLLPAPLAWLCRVRSLILVGYATITIGLLMGLGAQPAAAAAAIPTNVPAIESVSP